MAPTTSCAWRKGMPRGTGMILRGAEEFAALMQRSGLHVVEVVPLTFGACTLYVATPAEES